MDDPNKPGLILSVLGPLRIALDGQPLPKLATVRAQALLVYLAAEQPLGQRSQRRETLIELLWPGMPPTSGRKNLRQTLYYLRQAIPERSGGAGPFLVSDRHRVEINPAFPLWLDAADFLLLLDGPQESQRRATTLYRGDFLADLFLEDSSDFEEWASARRAFFRRKSLDALEGLAAEALKAQAYLDAREYAERRLEIDNLQENAHYQLMEILALSGHREEALAQYETCRRLLGQELGLEPSIETDALYQRIAAGDALVVQLRAAGPAGYEDLEFIQPSHNLPHQTTPLIGREREVGDLVDWLAHDPERRLVTIVGPGGIGKSRLSLEVASNLLDRFADGVFFTSLAPLESVRDIVLTLADSLGFRFRGPGEAQEQLLDYLALKRLLLVMDNFEHLLEGAELVATILSTAPEVKILATSRQRLGLTAETLFHISGLTYPSGDEQLAETDAGRYAAVRLLQHQAELIRPRFNLDEVDLVHAGRIARLVQGMPLAIFLAAGWLEILSLEEIADEIASSLNILEGDLRDLPQRQRSVRAVFDSSWRRLTEDERGGLAKLTVFRGGFTRNAAAAVAGIGLQTLRTLEDKSLIGARRPGRYEIHELLRQFAAEKLERAGLAEGIHAVHADYYLDGLAGREADLRGRRQLAALDEIEADFENVRAAWNWALRQEQWALIDQALENLFHFVHMRGRHMEGAVLLQAARDETVNMPPHLWGRLSNRIAFLQADMGVENEDAVGNLERALTIALEQDDRSERAFSLLAFGQVHSHLRFDLATALDHFEQSLACYQELDDAFYSSRALHRIGYCYGQLGQLDLYMDFTGRSLELAQAIGNQVDTAHALHNLGSGMITNGKLEDGKVYLDQAIAISLESGDQFSLAHSYVLLGLLYFLQGEMHEATMMASKSLVLTRKIGFGFSEAYTLALNSLLDGVQGDYPAALQWSEEGQALSSNLLGQVLTHWALSIAHVGLGQAGLAWNHACAAMKIAVGHHWPSVRLWPLPVMAIALDRRGRSRRAVELLALVESHPLSPVGWQKHWALLVNTKAKLRAEMGDLAFDEAWQKGQSLDLNRLLDQLLAEVKTSSKTT